MIDPATLWRLGGWLLYLGIALALIGVRLMPMSGGTLGFPGPDVLTALTLAWVLRRPDQVPMALIAIAFLAEDVLLMRPPGLWAAIVVTASAFLRHREHAWRDMPFAAEWALVGLVLAAMMLAERTVMAITFNAQPALGQHLLQLLATLLVYPLIVLAARAILGMRRAAPGEVDRLGHRR
ncbi:rod shape-determining protein MreD [Paracoccus sp. p4-l81]|uniref:rod shape-determining protein MreD n=1 Tax=Paracoccus sp. p4-l81 TaxID=3342806 RepID=UPI0035B7E8D3